MLLREPETVRWGRSHEAEVIRAVRRYDDRLKVWWGLALPDDVRGRNRNRWTFRERWTVYRQGKHVRVPVEQADGESLYCLQPSWHPVTVIQEPDGGFRQLDERLLHWLYRCDQFRLYGSDNGAVLAQRSGSEAAYEMAQQRRVKEGKNRETLEEYTKENFHEVADAIDAAMRQQGVSL